VLLLIASVSLLMSPLAPLAETTPCPTEMVRAKWTEPIYPPNEVARQRAGKVELEAVVAADGTVKKVKRVSGEDEFTKTAEAALKQWTFQPCKIDGTPVEASTPVSFEFHVGTWDVASGKEPPFSNPDGTPSKAIMRVRVSGGVAASQLRYKVTPRYPEISKLQRVQGTVVLHVVIGRDGGPKMVEIKSGDPVLAAATVDAVRQWRYASYYLNGLPVEVDTLVTMNFDFQ
jgi:TonB family protein